MHPASPEGEGRSGGRWWTWVGSGGGGERGFGITVHLARRGDQQIDGAVPPETGRTAWQEVQVSELPPATVREAVVMPFHGG